MRAPFPASPLLSGLRGRRRVAPTAVYTPPPGDPEAGWADLERVIADMNADDKTDCR